jgi:protein-tyrosine sulfotransferase
MRSGKDELDLSQADERPIFILCVARTGSTLLRRILDAHQDVACPPETNICTAFGVVDGLLGRCLENGPSGHAEIDRVCRRLADETLGAYARRHHKSRWADKSLPSVDHADLLRRVYPAAQFVCLYRNPLDTIASLLEASPYGFSHFNLEQYVARFPGNTVVAAASLWAEKVAAMLDFCSNADTSSQTYPVRYEDLVRDPRGTLELLFKFLGLPWSDAVIDADHILSRRPAGEPGDYKLRYTSGIHQASLGRGSKLPLELLPALLVDHLNDLNASLGYPAIGAAEQTVEPETDAATNRRAEDELTIGNGHPDVIPSIEALFESRVTERLSRLDTTKQPTRLGNRISVKLADSDSTWTLDFVRRHVLRNDTESDGVMWSDSRTLLEVANGHCNPGVAMRQSRIRFSASAGPLPASTFPVIWDDLDLIIDLITPSVVLA